MKTLLLVALVALSACGKKANDDGTPKVPRVPGTAGEAFSQTQAFVDAVQDDRPSIVESLLAQGANPDTLLPDGSTPLTYSILRNNNSTVDALD